VFPKDSLFCSTVHPDISVGCHNMFLLGILGHEFDAISGHAKQMLALLLVSVPNYSTLL